MRAEVIGVVTGLRAEARLAAPLGVVAAGGGTAAGAAAAAERLAEQGVTALVSFGLCGGLDPACPAGTLLVPRRVGEVPTDAALSARLGGWSADSLAAADRIVATRAEKQELFAATGAAGVDLESGAVAAVAARHGLAFAVLRAVCDPAGFDLPPLAFDALDAAGRMRPGRVAASLLARPGQLPALIALARHAAAARAALLRRVGDILRRDRRPVA